jgi:hypothetical protein
MIKEKEMMGALTLKEIDQLHFNHVRLLEHAYFDSDMLAYALPRVKLKETAEILSVFFWAYTFVFFDYVLSSNPLLPLNFRAHFLHDTSFQFHHSFKEEYPDSVETDRSLKELFNRDVFILQKAFNARGEAPGEYRLGVAIGFEEDVPFQNEVESNPIYRWVALLMDASNAIIDNDNLTLEMLQKGYHAPAKEDQEAEKRKILFYQEAILEKYYQLANQEVAVPLLNATGFLLEKPAAQS